MDKPSALVEFEIDDAYLAEFYVEWRSAASAERRVDRVARPLVILLALAFVGLAFWKVFLRPFFISAIILLLFITLDMARQRWRRHQWLAAVRRLPWAGKRMRLEVHQQTLVQVNEFQGDARYQPTGELLDTPNGYLVRYFAAVPIDTQPGVSPNSASVYIPHRCIEPPMTRAEFRLLVSNPSSA